MSKKKTIFVVLISAVILCRLYVLIRYCFHNVDVDQALMWYATAEFGHFKFPEPRFWGQSYGMMIEALCAVPLYWMHVPFNIALPLVTCIIGVFPFLFISILLYKKGYPSVSFIILLIMSMASWRFDFLTSIPRSWICGFPLAILGSILLDKKSVLIKLISGILLSISVVITQSSICIVLIGILGYLIWNKIEKKDVWVLIGITLGIIVGKLIDLFYVLNPDCVVFGSYSTKLHFNSFISNIHYTLPYVLSNLIINLPGVLSLVLLVIIPLFFFKIRKYKTLVMIVALEIGTVLICAIGYINRFQIDDLYISPLRFFLFFPYCLTLIFYISRNEYINIKYDKRLSSILVIVIMILVGIKYFNFSYSVNYNVNELNNDDGVSRSVEVNKQLYKRILKEAKEENCNIIFFDGLNGDTLKYAIGAWEYNNVDTYSIIFERRRNMRRKAKNLYPNKIIQVTINGNCINDYSIKVVELNGKMSMYDYIELFD